MNLFSLYLFLTKNYSDMMHAEGWYITYVEIDNIQIYGCGVTMNAYYNEGQYNKTIENIKLHGIIINEDLIITDFNEKQFNDTLYLWQSKKLGLL